MNTEKAAYKLYNTIPGRMVLKVLTMPAVSKLAGLYMDCPVSKIHIKSFVKNNNINLYDYEDKDYKSFNDFFTRKIKKYNRIVNYNPENFISPCDAKLTVCPITKDKISGNSRFKIKGSYYNLNELLRNSKLAANYEGGYCLIFRLSVDDYHRYCYIDNGKKSRNIYIKGKLHTVMPVALERKKVFSENCREYTVMRTDNFDDVIQMEVGAMLVGKIQNHDGKGKTVRGQEKGMFLYGGSTIILLVKQDIININDNIIENSKNNIETKVKFGETIAYHA
ncbi:MAG: phosphatidylserine decarboxylase [Lachnospiraceae bacterium]|nr:phosphatidylserine decarboxylase [Lachnospiraceae bacterium]